MWNKNFTIVVLGQVASILGSAVQRICLSLYILELTGNTALYALILAVSAVPYVLLAPVAGSLSDRVSHKKIMVVLDFCSAGITALHALSMSLGMSQVPITTIAMVLLACSACLYSPAVTASIPQIVPPARLVSANAVVQQVGSLSNMIGPVIAGVIYGLFGIRAVIFINAATFFLSAIMEFFLRIPAPKKPEARRISFKAAALEMKGTAAYLYQNRPVVLSIIAAYGMYNILITPILSVYAPYYIKIYLGLSTELYGIIEGAAVSGMVLSGFLLALFPRRFRTDNLRAVMLPMSAILLVAGFSAFLDAPPLQKGVIFALCCLMMMFAIGVSNVVTLSHMQKVAPQGMLGRVSALSAAVATLAVPAGQIVYGAALNTPIPAGVTLIFSAIGAVFVTVFLTIRLKTA